MGNTTRSYFKKKESARRWWCTPLNPALEAGRCMNSRTTWCTEGVPGQPGVQRNSVSLSKLTNKKQRELILLCEWLWRQEYRPEHLVSCSPWALSCPILSCKDSTGRLVLILPDVGSFLILVKKIAPTKRQMESHGVFTNQHLLESKINFQLFSFLPC